jgi:hypothetical protein
MVIIKKYNIIVITEKAVFGLGRLFLVKPFLKKVEKG